MGQQNTQYRWLPNTCHKRTRPSRDCLNFDDRIFHRQISSNQIN